jgi:hypothetical protein
MAVHVDIKLAPSCDTLTLTQKAIIMKHAQALAKELDDFQGEDGSAVATFLENQFLPDSLLIGDGDDPWQLAEGRDYIRGERRKAKLKGIRQARLARRAVEECGLKA